LFENQTWVGGSANSLSAVTGSFASGTPSGSLASPPAGYGVSAGQAVRTSTSTIVVGGISNDGITIHAFASSDSIFSLLPSLTNNSVAFGISSNGLLAAGYDGTNSAIWNLALNTESLLFNNGGLFLSVLSGGAASGVDGNGYGTVFSPFFGNIMSTCAFVTASGGSVAPQYYDSGGNCLIERTLLSEYLNPSGTLFVNIAGQGSVIDFSQINAVNFNRPGWTNGGDVGGNVPEPSTFLLMGVGLETIRRMRKRRSA